MSKEREFRKKMECATCKSLNYFPRKNQKTLSKVRLQLNKFCKTCGKHTAHKETK